MKKAVLFSTLIVLSMQTVFAMDTVFDSMDKATEVKLAPAIKTNTSSQTKNVNSAYNAATKSIKEEKFNTVTYFDRFI